MNEENIKSDDIVEKNSAHEPVAQPLEASVAQEGDQGEKNSAREPAAQPLEASVAQEGDQIDKLRGDHRAICAQLGLNKPLAARGAVSCDAPKTGKRPYVVLGVAIVVLAAIVGIYVAFYRYVDYRESELAIARHDAELAKEQARRDRVEYADIAFLDSLPPYVAISMDGKALYAKTPDGAYTELRARESTWIRNLPIKEDTVLKFGFSAEGFRPLTRSVAYYDWFPSRTPGANPLQKAFRRVVLEPDNAPRVAECARLPRIGDADPCDWSVFREIAFRERYHEAVKSVVVDEASVPKLIAQNMALHPDMFREVGLDPEQGAKLPDGAGDAARALYKSVSENPFGMYGRVTIESDTPNTRVFFMSEPLMVLKPSGSYAQVQVSPGAPYAFSVYGNGRTIDVMQTLSFRLEAPDKPVYITEVTPLQWQCKTPGIDTVLGLLPPAIPDALMSPDYRHYMCDYHVKISVKFEELETNGEENTENAKKSADVADASVGG